MLTAGELFCSRCRVSDGVFFAHGYPMKCLYLNRFQLHVSGCAQCRPVRAIVNRLLFGYGAFVWKPLFTLRKLVRDLSGEKRAGFAGGRNRDL
jgi:hypothetical protein